MENLSSIHEWVNYEIMIISIVVSVAITFITVKIKVSDNEKDIENVNDRLSKLEEVLLGLAEKVSSTKSKVDLLVNSSIKK